MIGTLRGSRARRIPFLLVLLGPSVLSGCFLGHGDPAPGINFDGEHYAWASAIDLPSSELEAIGKVDSSYQMLVSDPTVFAVVGTPPSNAIVVAAAPDRTTPSGWIHLFINTKVDLVPAELCDDLVLADYADAPPPCPEAPEPTTDGGHVFQELGLYGTNPGDPTWPLVAFAEIPAGDLTEIGHAIVNFNLVLGPEEAPIYTVRGVEPNLIRAARTGEGPDTVAIFAASGVGDIPATLCPFITSLSEDIPQCSPAASSTASG